MKFLGNGALWNPDKNKFWYKFTNGVFETDDPTVIKKLEEKGFKPVSEESAAEATNPTVVISEDAPDLTEEFKTLRQLAKEQGIEDYEFKTAEELKELLDV